MHQRLGLEWAPGLSDALVGNTQFSWRSHVRSATDLMLGPMGDRPGDENAGVGQPAYFDQRVGGRQSEPDSQHEQDQNARE